MQIKIGLEQLDVPEVYYLRDVIAVVFVFIDTIKIAALRPAFF